MFLKVMNKEVLTHESFKHSTVPKDAQILDSKWAKRHMRCIGTGE